MRLAAILLALVTAAAPSPPGALGQSDLDAFMSRVLERRDDNWKKMQQYILDEEERLQITGPDGSPLYGFDRDYTWFIREGFFIRSPLRVNGVTIREEDRAAYESRWLRRERRREERARKNAEDDAADPDRTTVTVSPSGVEVDAITGTLEPRFVSAAYFLKFKFDPGHYALAGREPLNGREVLKIEYYPSKLFTEGRTKPDRRMREREDQIEDKMNKVSLVTLWIDPKEHQILQYTFDDMDWDFMPGRSLVRVDELKASMTMTQPFPEVWLPSTIEMRFGLMTALGALAARYDVDYHDYRLARVTSKIKPPQ